jgi:hypothetical protein
MDGGRYSNRSTAFDIQLGLAWASYKYPPRRSTRTTPCDQSPCAADIETSRRAGAKADVECSHLGNLI